ncbi:MAG: helix-turn-helix domain-containing protein, partial [Spirochaetales bacterium]
MESIGEKLRKAREDKQVSLDQVARETNIAKRYLIALEEEDSSQFPGETYALGFLRNYAEYLGLNSAELITLYKNMRLQEQPVPLEALLEKKRSLSPYIIGIVVGILVLGAGVGYYYLRIRTQPKEPAPVVQGVSRVEYRGQLLEQLFIEGDEITFSEPIGTIKVQKIGSTVDLVGIFG